MPSVECLKTFGVVHYSFLVGHKQGPKKPRPPESPANGPTHYPSYQHGMPCLVPWRDAKVGEEYSFDYGYLDKDNKDVQCDEDPQE